jgi:cytochrome c
LNRSWLGLLLALAVSMGCSSPDTDATVTSTTISDIESTNVATTGAAKPTTTLPSTSTTSGASPMRVLVFHKTAGFRHESIAAGVEALETIGAENGFEVTATEDAGVFSSDGLAVFQVIVFLNTTGDVLDESQQSAMEEFIASGKGFVGIHSAADTEYEWPWYGDLLGAYFESHPHPQNGVVEISQPDAHPVTEGLPDRLDRFDEWYDFREPPPSDTTILALLDESSYEGATMGEPHPIVWAQEIHGGRSVYIGFGHTSESFEEAVVRKLLHNAVRWAVGD